MGEESAGLRFSLSFAVRASSSSACFLRLFDDLGRDRRVAKFEVDFVFFALMEPASLAFDCLLPSLPDKDFNEIELNVFLCNDLYPPSSLVVGRFPSLDLFPGDGGGWLC